MEINKIYNCDCIEGLKSLPDNSVDLTVTSPPYDDLRNYGNTLEWNFDVFKPIAKELYRVTKPGGVVVWVVGDATIKGSETGTSFKQALYFKDECGFNLHDTMIYQKNGSSRPASKNSKRYSQIFEYMFVFTKGEIRKDITLIADKRNKWAGWAKWGKNTTFNVDGDLVEVKKNQPVISEYSFRDNIWKYSVSFNDKTGHPAVFPEKLAEDNILSWSNEGDLVLDPFMGSGTTAKMAMLNKRNFIGFEKNTEYYEKSLERIGKYKGKLNTSISAVTCTNVDGDEETLQYSTSNDSEFEKKSKLWEEKVKELENYFNEQTYSTLKMLKFTFESKSNDERVKKINVDNQQVSQVYEDNIVHPLTISTDETYESSSPKNDENVKVSFENNTTFEEYVIKTVEERFGFKRLPEHVLEINRKAKEEKEKEKLQEKTNPIQLIELRNKDFIEKPKRKRKTKSEIPITTDSINSSENNVIVESTKYNEKTGVVEAKVKIPESLEKIDITINSKDLIDTNTVDDLPFEFTEEERERVLGIPFGGFDKNGKATYLEPVTGVKVKRPRGRPRKNPVM